MSRNGAVKLLVCDICVAIAATALLLFNCLQVSPHKLLWCDEVFTALAIRGMSFRAMLDSLKDTINAMPPGYFVLLWGWTKIFGATDLSMRLMSSLGMAAAWLLCWLILRQACSRLTATTATALAIFTSSDVMYYNSEARGYSIYMAAFLGATYLLVISRGRKRGALFLALGTFVAYACLVNVHYVGAIYGAALAFAAGLLWLKYRDRGFAVYFAGAIAGMATGVFSIPFYLAQRELGTKYNWLKRPNLGNLVACYEFGLLYLGLIVLVMALVGFVNVVFLSTGKTLRNEGTGTPEPSDDARPRGRLVCIAAACLTALLMPLLIWFESQIGIKLFLYRYFLPSILVWACVFAMALEGLSKWSHYNSANLSGMPRRLLSVAPCVCSVALLIFSALLIARPPTWESPDNKSVGYVLEALKAGNATFVSNDLLLAGPVELYASRQGRHAKFAALNIASTNVTNAKISHSIDKRYWTGFELSADELRANRSPMLVFETQWRDWIEEGVVPDTFGIVRRLKHGLIVVQKNR